MALTILKPGLTNSVRIQRMQRHLLAPRRIGKLKLFDHQGKMRSSRLSGPLAISLSTTNSVNTDSGS